MSKTNNVIELNGKWYDVVTGQRMPQHASSAQHVMKMQQVEIVKRPHLTLAADKAPASSAPHTSHPSLPRSLKPIAAHKPSHSTTLMRHAVKSPTIAAKPNYKTQGALDIVSSHTGAALPVVAPKLSSSHINPVRLRHASGTRHSDMVRRFAPQTPVRARSSSQMPASPAQPAHSHHYLPPSEKPAIERPTINSHAPHRPESPKSANHQSSQAIFSRALENAHSHEQAAPHDSLSHQAKRHGQSHRRGLKILGISAAALLVVGAIGYFNKSAVQIQLASMHAGFRATLPAYKPTGYAVQQLHAASDAVTVAYRGPNNSSLTIAQKKSNWDSATLLDNYVATSDQSYQAYQANGRTVYIYGKGNATWVNGGVWYQVHGQSLGDDQLLKVASTM